MPDTYRGNGVGRKQPTARAWAALVDECMDRMDRHPPERADARLAWLARRLHDFMGAEAWWVAAHAGDDLAVTAASGPAAATQETLRRVCPPGSNASGSQVLDGSLLVARGCDPDAQEWTVVLQGRPGRVDLLHAQPIVSALVYAAVGFPRAPSPSGQAWPARHLQPQG